MAPDAKQRRDLVLRRRGRDLMPAQVAGPRGCRRTVVRAPRAAPGAVHVGPRLKVGDASGGAAGHPRRATRVGEGVLRERGRGFDGRGRRRRSGVPQRVQHQELHLQSVIERQDAPSAVDGLRACDALRRRHAHAAAAGLACVKVAEVRRRFALLRAEPVRLVVLPLALVPVRGHGRGLAVPCYVQQHPEAVLHVPLPLPHVDAPVAVEQHAVAVLLVLAPLAPVLLVRLVGARGVLVRAMAMPLLAALEGRAAPLVQIPIREVHGHLPRRGRDTAYPGLPAARRRRRSRAAGPQRCAEDPVSAALALGGLGLEDGRRRGHLRRRGHVRRGRGELPRIALRGRAVVQGEGGAGAHHGQHPAATGRWLLGVER
mmetsp:Transcript_22841/g.65923  ORF Transcript_22841/g.65923 Transcript_22841/m.65923 type:complete len:372 (-) Transcript_22841:956-2071(-)